MNLLWVNGGENENCFNNNVYCLMFTIYDQSGLLTLGGFFPK